MAAGAAQGHAAAGAGEAGGRAARAKVPRSAGEGGGIWRGKVGPVCIKSYRPTPHATTTNPPYHHHRPPTTPKKQDALLKSVLGVVVEYHRELLGIREEEEEPDRDEYGNTYKTAAQLAAEEAAARAARAGGGGAAAAGQPAAAPKKKKKPSTLEQLTPDRATAVRLVKELFVRWQAPIETLGRAGRAFEGLESLLGGSGFELEGGIWKRQGWAQLDELRKKLEDLRELRDLVRSLGRGGGWGPLRRAPVQKLDMKGRNGLLRTVLEAQETRGLTRSGDISRLLPAEAAVLARGRSVRQAKLLFYARLAEKGLQTYERDGWSEFPTQIHPERREIRPTADRGPILLCVDTSGSMRGARETVAKALALECMRAAREQERDCYVFAFSGPQEVRTGVVGRRGGGGLPRRQPRVITCLSLANTTPHC